MLNDGNVVDSKNEPLFSCTDPDDFIPLFDKFMSDYTDGGGFVFVRSGGHDDWCDQLRVAISENEYAYFNWDMETDADHTDIMNVYRECLPDDGAIFRACKATAGHKKLQGIDAVLATRPTVPVFVFIKKYLQAGKTIDTRNVLAVIDLPIAGDGKVDSLVQGLIGRCCGYGKNRDVMIFTDIKRVEAYVTWLNDEAPEKSIAVTSKATFNTRGEVKTLRGSAYFST
jgi:hypothetical protein